ncbi:GPI mannosyltransferase 3-like [Sycon ciliatum]|uniref:GPI mannosyltransferase 3-like n=1 Tax=Sycon ciliatum TaxID=27933 RepID=UPI0031F6FE70
MIAKSRGSREKSRENKRSQLSSSTQCHVATSFTAGYWRWLPLCLIAFRLFNAVFLVQTYFVADEYWQCLEVAHKLVFGYGYLTWEWVEGIRGYFHPVLFASLYKALQLTGLDCTVCLAVGPRLLQAMFVAWSDWHMLPLAERYFSADVAPWVLLSYICTWTNIYCMARTLSNSLEAVFCIVALSHWHWCWSPRFDLPAVRRSFVFAALSCLVRPTAAVLWLPLTAHLLWTCRRHARETIISAIVPVAVVSLLLSFALDSLCYGRPVLVQWNFLKFNFLNDLASLYGTHPWHWYVTSGLPTLLGTTLLTAAMGLYLCNREQNVLAAVACVVVLVNSFVAHKEFRFFLFLLPIAAVYAGKGLHCVLRSVHEKGRWQYCLVLCFMVVPQFAAAVYFGVVHQSGTVSVMRYLDSEASLPLYSRDASKFSVLFLMPCHATPYHSHLHRNISMEFLTCPPLQEKPTEDVVFYGDPVPWLHARFDGGARQFPSHIVLFDVLEPVIRKWLHDSGYRRQASFFHSHFPEGRVGQRVLVYNAPIK